VIEVSTHETIEQVLQQGFYQVPRFQRPHFWTADNIGDFWTDTVQDAQNDYFIGAFIVYEMDEREGRRLTEYAIVDGQQRLTTITILLSALRDALHDAGAADLADGVQQYISRTDRRNQQRLILSTEGGFPFFQARIQSHPQQETSGDPLRADEKLIQAAYVYFKAQLDAIRESVMRDSRIAAPDRAARYVLELENIRDRILGLNVILVIVDNEDDSYVIFETLNTRGKDLNLADLVRNFLLRDLREADQSNDLPRVRFNRVLARLQDPDIALDPAEFILHSWNSRFEYQSSKTVFRAMKERLRTREQKAELLRALETDVEIYIRVRRPLAVTWTHQMREVERSVRALRVFNMSQPVPVLLAALRAYDERVIRLATLKRLFRAIEVFHFTYTAVAGKSSSGGISKRYALHARQFLDATAEAAGTNVQDLIGKLRAGLPTRDEFVAGFQVLGYSSTEPRAKPLIQYVLEGLYRHAAPGGAEINFRAMTIEHIAPERPRDDDDLENARIASIGNLMLVSEELNNALANKSFSAKKTILADQVDLVVDEKIAGVEVWDDEAIDDRTKWLAGIAFDEVWRLP
jgi:hypothetical protein